jgi:hypothetical protein
MPWSMGLLGAASSLNLSFVGSTNVNATSIAIPALAQVGDLAILHVTGADGSGSTAATPVTPTNWSLISAAGGVSSNNVAAGIYYKVLVSTDLGTSVTTSPTYGFANRKIILIFRPDASISNVSTTSVNAQGTSATPSNQSINLASQPVPSLAIAGYYSSGTVTTRGSSVTMNEVVGSSATQYLKYLVYNSVDTPSNITISMSDNGNNALVSGALLIS